MKYVIALAALALISGCSSSPKVKAEKPQYCHTSQTIKSQNGDRVESQTVVECTDDQIKRVAQKRLGSSPYCGEFTYWMQIGGNNVQRKGISCQKPDGSWEVINTTGY
jgi:hypothetical protein